MGVSKSPDVSTGLYCQFSDGVWGEFEVPVNPFQAFNLSYGVSKQEVDVTHFRSTQPGANEFGGMVFMAGKLERVELNVDLLADPNVLPPVHQNTYMTLSLRWPDGSSFAATEALSVQPMDYSIQATVEDKMITTCRFLHTGIATHTASTDP